MNSFDQQTLQDLEFTTIQEWLEELGIGPTAKKRLRELSPSSQTNFLRLELDKLKEFHTIRTEGESFPGLDFDELQKELRFLPIHNAVLEQE
jgi:DNA mismatch repair protein MutS2